MKNNLDLIKFVAFDIKKEGGNAYFVGGYVRDKILGKENKDIDVEIFGLEPLQLKSILSKYGEVNEVGASFGVFMINGYDIDEWCPHTCDFSRGLGHIYIFGWAEYINNGRSPFLF